VAYKSLQCISKGGPLRMMCWCCSLHAWTNLIRCPVHILSQVDGVTTGTSSLASCLVLHVYVLLSHPWLWRAKP
jgi:hypothetical protein